MHNISKSSEVRHAIALAKQKGLRIGFVPTMGNLHEGHISLIKAAVENTDFVVCSIFVNPLQFGPNEDLDAYPRTLQDDLSKLEKSGCDLVFLPLTQDIISTDHANETSVHVPGISDKFCGRTRPGHFDGVSTIVCKLLNIIQPHVAFFGLKDYQQFLLITKMVKDLAIPVLLEGIETMREASGLAMSSRNIYLSPQQKQSAAELYACLKEIKNRLLAGQKDFKKLEESAFLTLKAAGFTPEYIAICDANDLKAPWEHCISLVILAAAKLGKTRLIDNLKVELNAHESSLKPKNTSLTD